MDEYLGDLVFQRKSAYDYPGAFRVSPNVVDTLISQRVLCGRVCPAHYGFIMNTVMRKIFLNVCNGTLNRVDFQIMRDLKEHKIVSRVYSDYTEQNFRERQSFRDYYFPKNMLVIDAYIINYMIENGMMDFVRGIFAQKQNGINSAEFGIGGCVNPLYPLRIECENEMLPFRTSGFYYYTGDEFETIVAKLMSMDVFVINNPEPDNIISEKMTLKYH